MTDGTNEALRTLSAQLGRVEGELSGIRSEMARMNDRQERDTGALWGEATKTRERVDGVEKRERWLFGVAAGVSLVVSAVWAWIRNAWSG